MHQRELVCAAAVVKVQVCQHHREGLGGLGAQAAGDQEGRELVVGIGVVVVWEVLMVLVVLVDGVWVVGVTWCTPTPVSMSRSASVPWREEVLVVYVGVVAVFMMVEVVVVAVEVACGCGGS